MDGRHWSYADLQSQIDDAVNQLNAKSDELDAEQNAGGTPETPAEEAPAEELTLADAATDEPAAAPAAAASLPAGAVAANADGSAPEGYEVKGNADSGKYHQPGGQWYDATIAEFWFKTEADAEAAGFVKAGS